LDFIKPLKAQVIEISKAEKVFFTKNLLHCTATTTPKNENASLRSFYPLCFWIIFNKASNVTGKATQSGRFYSSRTVDQWQVQHKKVVPTPVHLYHHQCHPVNLPRPILKALAPSVCQYLQPSRASLERNPSPIRRLSRELAGMFQKASALYKKGFSESMRLAGPHIG
jgi:hypothetical protein